MDLRTDIPPSDSERQAIDEVLASLLKDGPGGVTAEAGSAAPRGLRHLLLPVLHAIQDGFGWISPGALNHACRRLDVPPAEAYGVATFYALFSAEKRPPITVHVCDDICCLLAGAESVCEALGHTFAGSSQYRWHRSPCLGLCELAPAAFITAAGPRAFRSTLAPASSERILQAITAADDGPASMESVRENVRKSVPEWGRPHLRLLRRVGVVDPRSLDDYRAHGGYAALRRAFEMGAEAVVREVVDSRLTGRGGAAFPTGRKWQSVVGHSRGSEPPFLVCNADESEPGTFKDRVLMEGDPFGLIESMTIAAFATGCRKGFIYIRGEYPLAEELLSDAIAEARKRRLLGEDIMGRGFHFDVELRRGAGAYICGEETALFNSIEGFRGEPRNKPPFPTQVGLFGRPTVVNNVETLFNVPDIVLEGAAGFASLGTEDSTGTKLFCLSGHVRAPGVYEVPFGTTAREIVERAGVGGSGRVQAVLLGGAAGTFLAPDELDMPLTFEAARARSASLGSAALVVFDDTVDLRKILLRIASFFRDESCGQCVPCRVGTVRQEELLTRLTAGMPLTSVEEELALLEQIAQVMRDASICGLGHTASNAVESALRRWDLFGEGKA